MDSFNLTLEVNNLFWSNNNNVILKSSAHLYILRKEILVRLGKNINLLFIKINTHKPSKVLLV